VLALAAETMAQWPVARGRMLARIAGLCGRTPQALGEAAVARRYGYEAGLLSLGAWKSDPERAILRHCARVAREIPLIGFYLQPAVGVGC